MGALQKLVHPEQTSVRRIVIRDGQLQATVAGEATPRRFEHVDATLRLGRGYSSIHLDLHGGTKFLLCWRGHDVLLDSVILLWVPEPDSFSIHLTIAPW